MEKEATNQRMQLPREAGKGKRMDSPPEISEKHSPDKTLNRLTSNL